MDEVRREEGEREGFVWYVVTAVKMCWVGLDRQDGFCCRRALKFDLKREGVVDWAWSIGDCRCCLGCFSFHFTWKSKHPHFTRIQDLWG